ncbi:MAG TPA: hypothetical protein VHU40_11010 [Polyangia bacterium]|jgi:hypothetical protein|nr:hypothetical protein [Polyangia bacterium]
MASGNRKSNGWARLALVSWSGLALYAGACGGGSGSASDAGATDADADGLPSTACTKQVVTKGGQPYVINDFSTSADGKTVSWGYTGGNAFSGYSFTYPDTIVSDATAGAWHLTGTVNTYSGFALGFSCAVDASMFTGISFSIKGNPGPSTGGLTLSVNTSPDDVNDGPGAPTYGKCVPKTSRYDGTCLSPKANVSVIAEAATVKIKWADLKGGAPQDSVSPDSISGIVWTWDWIDGGTPFPTDITVDDVAFTID